MSRQISIHEAAELELNEAADFYDIECSNLGSVFLDEVQRAIRKISEFPDASLLLHGRVRKKSLAKFPFSLIYSTRPDEIRILAIAHQRRRPFYWRGRR